MCVGYISNQRGNIFHHIEYLLAFLGIFYIASYLIIQLAIIFPNKAEAYKAVSIHLTISSQLIAGAIEFPKRYTRILHADELRMREGFERIVRSGQNNG